MEYLNLLVLSVAEQEWACLELVSKSFLPRYTPKLSVVLPMAKAATTMLEAMANLAEEEEEELQPSLADIRSWEEVEAETAESMALASAHEHWTSVAQKLGS